MKKTSIKRINKIMVIRGASAVVVINTYTENTVHNTRIYQGTSGTTGKKITTNNNNGTVKEEEEVLEKTKTKKGKQHFQFMTRSSVIEDDESYSDSESDDKELPPLIERYDRSESESKSDDESYNDSESYDEDSVHKNKHIFTQFNDRDIK